jgi:elongation factor G
MENGSLISFPIVGVRVCINDGATHPVDSSDLAFQLAARSAFREAYNRAQPILLEPLMKVVVETPEEFSGTILGSLNRRRGVIVGNIVKQFTTVVEAEVPLGEMFGYSNELRSFTQGKAEFSMEFKKYGPIPKNIQEQLIRDFEEKRKKRL